MKRRIIYPLALLLLAGCGETVKPVAQPAPVPNRNQAAEVKTDSAKPDSNPADVSTVKTDGMPPTTTASSSEPAKTPAVNSPTKTSSAAQEEPPFEVENGFTLLTLADFEPFGTEADTWEASDEGFFCTGRPRGYLYSRKSYRNFTLKLDYAFDRPESLKNDAKFKGNTGFLIYITGEHHVWPVSLEVQGKHVQMGAIKENGGASAVTATDNDDARQKARHGVGEWNSLEIVSVDGSLSVSLNGVPISKSEPNFLSEGLIGVQSEDFSFEVRRMRIRRD